MSDDRLADIHEFPRVRPRVKKLRLLLVLFGVSLLALVSLVFGMMMAVASELPSLENREEYRNARNSVLTDVHGRPLGILRSPDNRVIVRPQQISLAVKHAVIAIEDKRFYENEGVDVRGIARAFFQDVLQRKAVQGGSTISQQFVKNALKAQNKRTVFQKLRESALAYHLNREWSKEKILAEYLNAIYFGNGAYGVESAARTYFGREPGHEGCGENLERPCSSELKPHEAALLAGVIASPGLYDPVSNPRQAEARRNLVLKRMLEQQYLSPVEYEDARQQALPARQNIAPPREKSATPAAPYFTTWIKQQVVDRFGARRAFTGGLRIRTTLDLELQKAAEQAVGSQLGNPEGPTAALVAIDNDTGEVRAMVGGRDYNEAPFNLATQGQRQPGSSFKPFILAEALRQGISPGSVWASQRKVFKDRKGRDFVVNNYEGSYSGATSLARATTFSDNSVYAELGIKVGTRRVARLARRMGVRTPVSINYAMTLGGLKEGVTPLDMAHAYQTFATGGRFVTGSLGPDRGPVGIREVQVIGKEDPLARNERRLERVLPRNVANTATQILATVVSSGTATRAQIGEFAAGKTGTTEDYGDAWFVGYTERLTVAVWVGYADKVQPMKTEFGGAPVAGGTFPAAIWRDFMTAANRIIEERVAKDRIEKGLPPVPEETTTGPAGPAPAVPPAATAPQQTAPAQTTPRAPQPAQPPQQPAPRQEAPTPARPPAGGGGGGGAGGGGAGAPAAGPG
jgi:penicillin-binding protein 1A